METIAQNLLWSHARADSHQSMIHVPGLPSRSLQYREYASNPGATSLSHFDASPIGYGARGTSPGRPSFPVNPPF
jgi:hypothetical protein